MMKNIISIGIWVLGIVSVFTESSIAGWGKAQAFYPGGHMMGGGYMGWSMIFVWVILLVILVFVVKQYLYPSDCAGCIEKTSGKR